MSVEQLRNNVLNTSVVVHIDELLDEQRRETIECTMEEVEGVGNARFNETRHHLLIVDYDPKRVNSCAILTRVKLQHLHAQLI